MQIRISRWVLVLFSVFATWSALALIGLLRQNPFRVATEMATAAGGWSSEQVRFEQGSYLFLFVCSRASARVAVTTDAGEMPAEIKLLHVPFAGWSVQSFEIGDPLPQQAEGRWRGRVELTLLSTSVGGQAVPVVFAARLLRCAAAPNSPRRSGVRRLAAATTAGARRREDSSACDGSP